MTVDLQVAIPIAILAWFIGWVFGVSDGIKLMTDTHRRHRGDQDHG
jgi:hypothetical protein